MREVTQIMAYYENPTMLQKHLHNIRQYEKKHRKMLRLIVVDDGSPTKPARFDSETACHAEIYRMKVDIRWNQDACRNLGVEHAKTEWVLLTDMDHLVPFETMGWIMTQSLDPKTAYRFSRVSAPDMLPYKPHPNSWLMTRELFKKVGGYDERLAGWYGTDGDFLDRVAAQAMIIQLNQHLIRVPREVIPDSSTTSLSRKSPEDFQNIRMLRRKYAGTPPLTLSFPWERVT